MREPIPSRTHELPPYEVICLEADIDAEADGHGHVRGAQTWDPDGGRRRWTLVEVIAAVRDGEVFQAGKGADGQAAVLEPAVCPRCPVATLIVNPAEARPDPCG